MDYSRILTAMNPKLLFSGRFDRYYRWAACAVVAAFLVCLYVLYCYYLTLMGRTTALQHVGLRIILGAIGAVGALSGILLSKVMWTYYRQGDATSNASKRFWFFIMTFVSLYGCAAYYFLVYERVRAETELVGKPDKSSPRTPLLR